MPYTDQITEIIPYTCASISWLPCTIITLVLLGVGSGQSQTGSATLPGLKQIVKSFQL